MPKPLSPKGDSYQNAEFTSSVREPYTFLAEEGGPLAVEGVFKMQKAECRRQNKPLSSSAMPKPLSPKGDSYQNV